MKLLCKATIYIRWRLLLIFYSNQVKKQLGKIKLILFFHLMHFCINWKLKSVLTDTSPMCLRITFSEHYMKVTWSYWYTTFRSSTWQTDCKVRCTFLFSLNSSASFGWLNRNIEVFPRITTSPSKKNSLHKLNSMMSSYTAPSPSPITAAANISSAMACRNWNVQS